MFIEQLDKTRLLITLEQEDLSIFDLDPGSLSMENKDTRLLFRQLLTLAAVKTGVVLKDKTVSVDMMPYDRGCFLLVTIKPKQERKLYRIKRNSSYLLVKFSKANDMLDAVKMLYCRGYTSSNCSLYRRVGVYYLLIVSKATVPDSVRLLLSEYGELSPCSNLTVSRLAEACDVLHEANSIEYIGKNL